MSNTIKLSDIQKAADAKYGHLTVDYTDDKSVRLLNPLRLGEKKRQALMAAQEKFQDADANHSEIIDSIFLIVADNEERAKEMLAVIGDDLAVKVSIFEEYGEGTQVGEASGSEN